MFRSDGSLAVVDFGIAKHVDAADMTGQGEILGTPRYMSPEQVQGKPLDLRTDIYSAGVLLYQMLTGRHLFEGNSAVEVALHHLNTPPSALPDELSKYQRPAGQAARERPRRALSERRRGARLHPAQVRRGRGVARPDPAALPAPLAAAFPAPLAASPSRQLRQFLPDLP
jgi:serine/threonine protein kinase